MAMEDAVALVAALDEHPGDVDAALADYETVRRPQVAKIQDSARPSLSWWEHFGRSHDNLPPWQFAYHFFTRSLTDAKLRRRDDTFVAATHERWRTGHGADPLRSSLEVADRRLDGRVGRRWTTPPCTCRPGRCPSAAARPTTALPGRCG